MRSNQRQIGLICSRSLTSSLIKQLILFLCLIPAGVAASNGIETVTLQLKYYHQFQFAGYYAALEQGFYQEAGLDVKIKANEPGLESPMDEVLSGAAQYGVADNSLVKERLAGKPVVVLANIFQKSPAVWIVREDSGISGLHDLVGKRVMYNPGSTSELLVMLQVEGIPANKLNLVPSSFNIQDLIDGHIDAFNGYLVNEPYILQEQGVPYRLISPLNYSIDSYGDVLFTLESEIENHPERAKAFRLASLKGWQYAMDHPDEIIDLIRTKYGSKKSRPHLEFEAEAMRDHILPDLVAIGHINPGRWRAIAERIVAIGSTQANYDLLDGFLYDPSPKPRNLKQLYIAIVSVALLALLFLGVVIWVGRLNIRLRKSEANLNIAQKVAHFASWEWDVSSGEVKWSDEQYRIFGLEPGEIPPLYDYYSNALNKEDQAYTRKALEKALAGEADYDVEYRVNRENGEERVVHAQAIVERNLDGKPVRVIGTSHDITERKENELKLASFNSELELRVAQRTAQLRASNRELIEAKRITEEAMQSREYFLANISHEIRTPMNGILGTVDLLKMEALTQEQQDYLKVIQRSSSSLLTVINDVLDYSKLNIQQLTLNNKAFNLAVLLRETVEPYRTNLNDKTSLSLSIAPVLLDSQFIGDEIRLHQVLTNLLNNASKFTDRGFINVEVKQLEHEAKYTRIQINISDSGIGIDRDLQAKLFQPFTQADQSTTRRFGGTGLGLSICKQLLNLMDGSIVVESEADQGSTFTIDFVLQNTTNGDEREHTIANVLTPLNVLLVEDNPVNQAVAAKLLQRQGCEVTVANDGAQAVNKARTNSYDLILMDCDMPVMDGYEATRQIRQWEIEQSRKPIPIYALSAHALSEQVDVCYAAGMDGHLSKPIVLEILKALLLEVADQ